MGDKHLTIGTFTAASQGVPEQEAGPRSRRQDLSLVTGIQVAGILTHSLTTKPNVNPDNVVSPVALTISRVPVDGCIPSHCTNGARLKHPDLVLSHVEHLHSSSSQRQPQTA